MTRLTPPESEEPDKSLGLSGRDSGHEIAPIVDINDTNSVSSENEWALRDSNPRPQPCESVSMCCRA